MADTILILDFGSQYTQLIARRVRELNVYAEIQPYHRPIPQDTNIRGIILSGSPASVLQADAPRPDLSGILGKLPVLAICYGAQLLSHTQGGSVASSQAREYGRARLNHLHPSALLEGIDAGSQVWMSHGDHILAAPAGAHIIAATDSIPIAAFADESRHIYGLQFHPEVTHTTEGARILANFVLNIASCRADWTPEGFVEATVARLRQQIGDAQVVCALSGGVDSTVAAVLIHKAIGPRLHCLFVDNGLLRKNEYQQVLDAYQALQLNVKGIDAKADFLNQLAGKTDPEDKRKAIGRVFIEVFEREAKHLNDVRFLAQGTIYPDVIESVSVGGPSVTIKSHHNVGGLPARMGLELVEPLRLLFKDEVRRVGRAMGLSQVFLGRHPFPGPGLAIRIPGEVTPDKVALLQDVDQLFIQALRQHNLYDEVWQAFAVLLPVATVGVMGDERTYEQVAALRAVTSVDGMTADWARLPHEFLAEVSNTIINQVRGINRVVYDISSKPPATIEWE